MSQKTARTALPFAAASPLPHRMRALCTSCACERARAHAGLACWLAAMSPCSWLSASLRCANLRACLYMRAVCGRLCELTIVRTHTLVRTRTRAHVLVAAPSYTSTHLRLLTHTHAHAHAPSPALRAHKHTGVNAGGRACRRERACVCGNVYTCVYMSVYWH